MRTTLSPEQLRRTWALAAAWSVQSGRSSTDFLDGMMFYLIHQRMPADEDVMKRPEFRRAEFLEGAEALQAVLAKEDKNEESDWGGRRFRKINSELIQQILDLHVLGGSVSQIGRTLNIPRRTLQKWLERGRAAQSHRNPDEEPYRRLAAAWDLINPERN